MSEKWSWTDKDDKKRLNEIGNYVEKYGYTSLDDTEWLCRKLRAALREIDRFKDRENTANAEICGLKLELSDERTGAKHVATEAIRRTKETVKEAGWRWVLQQDIFSRVIWDMNAAKHQFYKAIDETEAK